ncbi:hypothetical protein SOVF_036520 [Spinacia oleracea]|nr:hypothetical protein SOVF_036520 [Spinacia oleracea]
MGFDNDCILNIQSLAGEYFCPVCHLLVYPNEALQAQCTHLYCKPCLTYVVSSTHACPYDGYRVTEADCKPLLESNKALADTIGKIQVHCLYYRTGCTWQGPFTDCITHCSTCSFGESPVLCNRCGVQIVHRQVQEHAQSCPGVQSQVQQPGTVQDSTSTGAVAAVEQSQTAAQNGLPVSQAQTSQASAPLVSSQDIQLASSVGQPQAAQNYQYYYQYQQGAQQYPQQPMQGYPPQVSGQAQTQPQQQVQPHAQPQAQQQPQAQTQPQQQPQPQPQPQQQPQQQPQAPPRTAPPPPQTTAQPASNAQSQVQSVGQAQPQIQTQGQAPPSHALPYNQSQPLPQAQPYTQPQPISQQQTQLPQYQQTNPYAQSYPPSQTQTQHYPYPHPQSHPQPQPQPHSQPIMQAPVHPPSQQNQLMNPNAQPQTQNSVTGYQSYPQPQPHPQAQVGAAHPMHSSGVQPQPQYPAQAQGKYPSQPSQMYPPQPYSNVANQQQHMSSAQGQAPPSGPSAQQLPVYPHSQQPGYPFQHRPGVQAAQQAAPQQYGQQQSFPGHGPYTQPQPPMTAQLHAQGPPQTTQQPQQNYAPGYGAQPNTAQNYAARPVAMQGAGSQPYAQAAGPAAIGQQAGHPQQSSRATGGGKPRDQIESNKESVVGTQVNEVKIKSENSMDGNVNGNESKLPGAGSKQLESDVQEFQQRIKEDPSEGASKASHVNITAKNVAENHKDARKKAEVQDLKHASNSHLVPQVHGANSFPSVDQGRNQLQPMHYGTSAQHRPGNVSAPQSTPQPLNSQQPGLGHPHGQFRPQGPGQAPQRPPFSAAENSQASIPKHPHGPIPPENASGGNLGPGSSGSFARPGNMGYHQGNMPPYQAGQPHNPSGEPSVGPSFAGPRPGAFDSHVGIGGRERTDAEKRPPHPMESEKFQGHRPDYFDGRKPEALSHAQPGIHPGIMKFGGPSAHDSASAPGSRDERVKLFPEERLKPFPHRDFEEDLRKFPRPSHFETGPSSRFGSHFSSSGPLDHGPHMFGGEGMPRPFDKAPHGFDHDSGLKMDSGPSRFLPPFHANDAGERSRPAGFPDDNMGRGDFGHRPDFPGPAPGPGFGRPRLDGLPPRSPGRDFPGFSSRPFGAYAEDGGNESRPFEGSRPYNFPAESFGKSIRDNRFPVPPNHLQRGELDVPGNLHAGEHFIGGPRNQDTLPPFLRREHMGPRNSHTGEVTAFGPSGGHPRMGEPPLTGNFPQHLPFGESFGGEKPGHPLVGEHGFRGSSGFQRYGREGGFFPEEMEPFDNPRMRGPRSIMCRICKVECGTVEGLDLHSQSREHQRKAREMVLGIKQSNKKKQKLSKDQASVEGRNGGRPKNSNFQGRGNKR